MATLLFGVGFSSRSKVRVKVRMPFLYSNSEFKIYFCIQKFEPYFEIQKIHQTIAQISEKVRRQESRAFNVQLCKNDDKKKQKQN